MKKTLLLLAAAIVAVSPLVAGNGDTAAKGNISAEIPAYAPATKSDNKETKAKKGPWDRKKYINLGYIKQSLSPEFGNAFESKFGASFSSGRNIYLHKKPIANILKFAIDFGSEVNYAQYKDLIGDYDYSDNDFGYTDESDNNYDLGYEDEEEDDFDDELNKSEPYHTSENTAQNDFFNKTAELLKEPEITEPDEEILMADGEVIVDEEIEDSEKSSDEFVTPFESSNQEVETEQIVLPAPEIDERIEEDLQSVVTEKAIDEQENDNGLNTQTPYENSYVAEPAPLIPDDEAINDDLIEQVARDVDKNFIYSKIERENLDDEDSSDVLTEDDLNFIDDINQGENDILEPVSDEPDNFEDSEDSSNYQEKEEQTPVVPVYPAETPTAQQSFEQGDHVSHPKYGEGIVEKMIKYGNKTLCSINFVNVGRRLLDPAISEISKV